MMNNFQIPPQMMQMLKGGANPQQMLMNMMQGNMGGNPMLQNVMSMMNNGNMGGIEQVARNLCRSKNIDPDELYKQVQNQFQ